MGPKLIQSISDSDSDHMVSSESRPRLRSSPDETPGFGSEPKRQKVEEDVDEKSLGSDGDELSETEDDYAEEIEDGYDDEDDLMEEVKQYSPKVTIRKKLSEDDEGYKRYVQQLIDSECFDLDEDPLDEYYGTGGHGVARVHFDSPYDAPHKEDVESCIDFAIRQQNEPLRLVNIVSANYSVEVGYVYYITFLAENSSSEVKAYQAEVYRDIWKKMELRMFREKCQQQPQPQQ